MGALYDLDGRHGSPDIQKVMKHSKLFRTLSVQRVESFLNDLRACGSVVVFLLCQMEDGGPATVEHWKPSGPGIGPTTCTPFSFLTLSLFFIFSVRTFREEMKFINRLTPTKYEILPGFVPNMTVLELLNIPQTFF